MIGAAQMLTVRVPLAVRKRGGRRLVVTPGGTMNRGQSGADSTLVKALARAFRWRRMMETGRYGTLNELAAAEKINSSYVSRLLRLTLLAPAIVEAILDGRQPAGMTLPGFMEPFPVDWGRQEDLRRMPITVSTQSTYDAYSPGAPAVPAETRGRPCSGPAMDGARTAKAHT